jgi:hypothetical protein
MEFDLADQAMVCGNTSCRNQVVLKGLLAGYYRDVVLPGYAPDLTCPKCKTGTLRRAAPLPGTNAKGFDSKGRRPAK